MKSVVLTHYLEFANAHFYVAIGDTLARAAAAAQKACGQDYHVDPSMKKPPGALALNWDNCHVLLFTYSQLDVPVIMHELGHVTASAFRHMGIKFSQKSEEAYRHHDQMLMRIFMRWAVANNVPFQLHD